MYDQLLGLNIIDWISILVVIVFQTMLFSIGIQYNKKLINYSAIIVYAGMIIFFFTLFLSDVKTTTQAFSNILNLENFTLVIRLFNGFIVMERTTAMKKYIINN